MRQMALDVTDRSRHVPCLGDHLDTLVALQPEPQSSTHHVVVIRDHEPDRRAGLIRSGGTCGRRQLVAAGMTAT